MRTLYYTNSSTSNSVNIVFVRRRKYFIYQRQLATWRCHSHKPRNVRWV